jgi:hypothetical protein
MERRLTLDRRLNPMKSIHFEVIMARFDMNLIRETLRPIRLYHWVKLQEHRKLEQEGAAMKTNMGNMIANSHNRICSQHLGFIQSMNEHFEPGDTAERDQIVIEEIEKFRESLQK